MNSMNLRGLRAAILDASGSDAPELQSQLGRIGISVSVRSPVNASDLRDFDFVFITVMTEDSWPIAALEPFDPLAHSIRIVILESEAPTILDRLASLNADAVIVKPFRPVGLLACLIQAQQSRKRGCELRERVARLERKLRGFRIVEKAKEILAARHQVPSDKAFVMLRNHAMEERTTVECVAETIVSADRLLSAPSQHASCLHSAPKG